MSHILASYVTQRVSSIKKLLIKCQSILSGSKCQQYVNQLKTVFV